MMFEVIIMMFEFGEYCFIKWKFKFKNFLSEIWTKRFSISRNFYSINRNFCSIDKENNPGVIGWFNRYSILVQSIVKSIRSIERNSQMIETNKIEFFAEFSSTILNVWRGFSSLVNGFMKYFDSPYMLFDEI